MMHNFFSPWYASPLTVWWPFFLLFPALILLLALWSIAIKGYALWHAAKHDQKEWFVALLVINTIGILELVYLIWFCPGAPLSKHKRTHTSHHA